MAFVHGKNTVITIDGDDISAYCNTSNLKTEADEHDTTTYGQTTHTYTGGLLKGSAGASGIYDNSVGGPAAVLRPLQGTVVELVRRPEGTGTGKPQQTVDVLVKSFEETAPVADMVTWSVELTLSGPVVVTTQA